MAFTKNPRMVTNGELKCCRCGQYKPSDDFPKDKSAKSGYNSICKLCLNNYNRNYNKENRQRLSEQQKGYKLKHRYGITIPTVAAILQSQGGLCAVCHKVLEGKDICVDHDHRTNMVRGVLCLRCNMGIGYFLDSADTLKAAAAYLEDYYGR